MSNLPKGWEIKSIKDLKLDISDGNYSSKYPTQNDFIECGVPFIRANNIKSMTVIDKDMRFISEKQHNELKKGHLKKNDILITTRGDIGQVSLVPDKYIGANINAQIVRIGVSESIFFKYLAYILTYEETQKNIKSLETGTALKQLPVKKLDLLNIPLPPLEEQKKIADILTTVDKKIAFVEENISATEKLKKGLMQKLLTEGIGHTEFKDSELGRIPQSWEVVKFKEITKVRQGLQIPISKRKKEKCENCYEYITIQFIKNNKEVEYIENPQKTVICTENDILMTRTGNTGIVVTNVKGVFHNNFFLIDFDRNEISKEYLVYYLNSNSIQKEILLRAGATTIPDLNHGDFYSIKFISPPLEEQKQIAEILSTVDNKLENLKEKKQSFEELKKGLMQKLLTGEVRV